MMCHRSFKRFTLASRAAIFGLLSVAAPAIADSYVGRFATEGDGIACLLEIRPTERSYEGTLRCADRLMKLNAKRLGESIAGQFSGPGGFIGFTGELRGNTFILRQRDGMVLRLQRESNTVDYSNPGSAP